MANFTHIPIYNGVFFRCSSQFEAEQILTLKELLQILDEEQRITVFLHILDNSVRMLEQLRATIKFNAQFTSRTILISRSPYAIYQVKQ